MSMTMTSWDWTEAEQKFNLTFRHHAPGQAVGACPKCGEGDDRFVLFREGNFWCRVCNHKGWWKDERPSPEELSKVKAKEEKRKMGLYAQMHLCEDWLTYHRNTPIVYDAWMGIGFTEEEINKWGLGWCESCPLSPEHTSLTIPIWYKGKLWDIRHRLQTDKELDTGRYRSHVAGITPPFFNLDSILSSRQVYIVEGEKKCIKAASCVPAVIGYPGIQFCSRLPPMLNKYLHPSQQVIFLPDPGTAERIIGLVEKIKSRCYVVDLWKKADDFIIEYGQEEFMEAIKVPRPL